VQTPRIDPGRFSFLAHATLDFANPLPAGTKDRLTTHTAHVDRADSRSPVPLWTTTARAPD
jgi:hypothetical protein